MAEVRKLVAEAEVQDLKERLVETTRSHEGLREAQELPESMTVDLSGIEAAEQVQEGDGRHQGGHIRVIDLPIGRLPRHQADVDVFLEVLHSVTQEPVGELKDVPISLEWIDVRRACHVSAAVYATPTG